MKKFTLWIAACMAALAFGPLAAVAADCSDCGTVKAVKKSEPKGSGVGLVAGGVLGGVVGNQFGSGTGRTLATVGGAAAGAYAGNAVEKNYVADTTWKVTVTMDSGDKRTFKLDKDPGLAAGDRVRIVDNKPVKLQ
ncbi:glycine zipper 2TM domain-containing protein [Parasulfuritortus cantonensis]|uniref:Glycine zipper 2TM domain-containing protein n=1 Tax=Parasulfuritortus cantonensis TaxID=2528202 RepID=A0A4R1BM27_9PROT|nr:glycine zipper 2TM domain-containing protein [Parasulfuritortus cantonensis]TCJ18397.1 glycine zipper 2TM domain-containing protein [Parasulfuritortus cantonensis]